MSVPLPSTPGALWTSTAPTRAPHRSTLQESYDVVVVGAGITGLSTALLLAERGVRVLVVERRTVGAGTTGRSNAKSTILQGARGHAIENRHGQAGITDYVEGNRRGLELIRSSCDRLSVPYEVRDAWSYATTQSGARSLAAERDSLQRAGLDVDWEATTELPFPVTGAIRLADQLQLDPAVYLDALAAAFRDAGGDLAEYLPAVGVDAGPRRPRTTVHLAGGRSVQADWVVLATLLPFPRRTLLFATSVAYRSYLLAADPGDSIPLPTGMYLSVDPPTRSLRTATAADGSTRLLVGGDSHPTGHGHPAMQHVQHLADWAGEHFAIRSVTHRWSAQDYKPADVVPQVGPAPYGQARVLVASGFDKWGFTNGSAAALVLADTITASRPGWASAWIPRVAETASGAITLAKENAQVSLSLVHGWLTPKAGQQAPREGQGLVTRHGLTPQATSTVGGVTRTRSAVCTHLGGIVRWNDAEASWDCPLHGSRFDSDGSVICAPAVTDLPPASA